MGFFSNLKNAITGGAAQVTVQAAPAHRGHPSGVHITVVAKANANVNGVYLLVRATEHAELRDRDYADGQSRTEIVRGAKTSYETRIPIAGPAQLQEGQTYHFEGAIELPANTNPTFRGSMIQHVWEIQAGVDMTGNDPDSGWQPLEVA